MIETTGKYFPLLIFPEGGTTNGTSLINFKKGAFIAEKTVRPVILKWGLPVIILLSWGLAFFEYLFQVPANRIGHDQHGGPFNLIQLRIIQEVISLTVFTLIAIFVFKSIKLNWNHFAAFICLILAVWFVFRK